MSLKRRIFRCVFLLCFIFFNGKKNNLFIDNKDQIERKKLIMQEKIVGTMILNDQTLKMDCPGLCV